MIEPLGRCAVACPLADMITSVLTVVTAPDPAHNRGHCPMR
jgi:hypothetical protein